MTTVHTLASGSSGNALLLSSNETHILVDAGISCRRITTALKTLGLTASDLDAVLITHTHTDHIAGLQVLMKRTEFPVLASGRTCRELEYRMAGVSNRLQPLELMESMLLGGCASPLSLPPMTPREAAATGWIPPGGAWAFSRTRAM